MEHLVLTVIAEDQPGLVERLAHCIAEHDGTWLESRMSRMSGQFAGIVSVAVPVLNQVRLIGALQVLSVRGIRVHVAHAGVSRTQQWPLVLLNLVGNERPGIIRDISQRLTALGVNVENLSSEVAPAPMSSDLLFHAEALLALPPQLSVDELRESLENLADDLMVELSEHSEG